VLAFTPEMSTCQTISAAHPDDEWLPEDCPSVFNFPDDEALVQEEFEKNIDFALSVARSAADPTTPSRRSGWSPTTWWSTSSAAPAASAICCW